MRSACRYLISGEGAFSQAGELTLAFRLQWRRAGGHHAPSGLKVGLMGVAPNRSGPGATETAVASAKLDTAITHADGSLAKGGSLEFGAPEFERKLVLGLGVFENLPAWNSSGAPAR